MTHQSSRVLNKLIPSHIYKGPSALRHDQRLPFLCVLFKHGIFNHCQWCCVIRFRQDVNSNLLTPKVALVDCNCTHQITIVDLVRTYVNWNIQPYHRALQGSPRSISDPKYFKRHRCNISFNDRVLNRRLGVLAVCYEHTLSMAIQCESPLSAERYFRTGQVRKVRVDLPRPQRSHLW